MLVYILEFDFKKVTFYVHTWRRGRYHQISEIDWISFIFKSECCWIPYKIVFLLDMLQYRLTGRHLPSSLGSLSHKDAIFSWSEHTWYVAFKAEVEIPSGPRWRHSGSFLPPAIKTVECNSTCLALLEYARIWLLKTQHAGGSSSLAEIALGPLAAKSPPTPKLEPSEY